MSRRRTLAGLTTSPFIGACGGLEPTPYDAVVIVLGAWLAGLYTEAGSEEIGAGHPHLQRRQRAGRLYRAGERLSYLHTGIEGAMESTETAAYTILNAQK